MKKAELQAFADRLKAASGSSSAIESLAAELEAAVAAHPDDVVAKPAPKVKLKAAKAKAVKPRKKK